MSLRQSIYSTLFPHQASKKQQFQPAADNAASDSAFDETDTFDYASARDMQERTDFDARQQQKGRDSFAALPPLYEMLPAEENAATQPANNQQGFSGVNFDFGSQRESQSAPEVPKFTPPDLSAFYKEKTLSPYEQAQKNLADASAAPVDKKQNPWLNGLFVALQAANKFFNPQNQDEIQFLGEAKKAKNIARAQRDLAPLEVLEQNRLKAEKAKAEALKLEMERRKLGLDIEGVGLANQGKAIDNNTNLYKPLRESLEADGQVTPAEAAYFKAQTGMDIADYDARKMKEETVGGVMYQRPELGNHEYAPVPNAPIDQPKTFVKQKVGNFEGVTTSEKGLENAVGVETGNANRAQSQSQFNTREQNDIEEKKKDREFQSEKEYHSAVMDWSKRTNEATAKLAGAKERLATAEKSKADAKIKFPDNDLSDLDAVVGKAAAEVKEYETAAKEAKPKKIIRGTTAGAKTSSAKVATKTQVAAFAKSKGITFEQAKKQAQADGYTVK